MISTHTPLARCDEKAAVTGNALKISTHTPLARCDIRSVLHHLSSPISTHTPLARCDRNILCISTVIPLNARGGHYYF